jgi:hypothetical protein
LPGNPRRRSIEYGITELMPFGTVRILEQVLNLDAFEDYVRKDLKEQWKDDLAPGYSFLVALAFERLIDEMLLDPTIFGLQWNELVNRAHQRDLPFSRFPDKSNIGSTVKRLANQYREFLPVRTLAQLREKIAKARADLLPPLVRWSECSEFIQAPGAVRLESGKTRNELAMLFLVNFVQDVPYVVVAYNNTFQRGRWFEPQFEPLHTEAHFQKLFHGFKLGASYLWHAIVGTTVEDLFGRSLRAAKDWGEYYMVHPIIRRTLTDEIWDRMERIHTIEIGPSSPLIGLRSDTTSIVEKDYLGRLDDIFRLYDVRLVGETFTARIASNFLAYMIGAMTYYSGKLRLIRFVHPVAPGQNRYSYAIFSWVPVAIGDESEWLLFFNFCDDYSPRGLSAFKPIESFINTHQRRLQVTSFRFTSYQLLNHVLTRPDWSESKMSPLTREHNNLGTVAGLRQIVAADRDEKAFARGMVLELLMVLMLSRLGYEARWRVHALGKEMDVLGLRLSKSGQPELTIVECSTQYLPTDLEELREKLRLAKSEPSKLLVRFGKVSGSPIFRGWLVTTDRNFPSGVSKSEQITIVSWESLKNLLKKRHVDFPSELEEFLTREQLPARYILDPASIIAGTTPPPSEDGSPPKGTVMLHDGLLLPKNWIEILRGNIRYSQRERV